MWYSLSPRHGGRNGGYLAIGAIDAHDAAAGTAGVDQVGVERIGNNVAEFVAADGVPIHESDFAVIAAAQGADGTAVLLRAVDPIRVAIVGGRDDRSGRWAGCTSELHDFPPSMLMVPP